MGASTEGFSVKVEKLWACMLSPPGWPPKPVGVKVVPHAGFLGGYDGSGLLPAPPTLRVKADPALPSELPVSWTGVLASASANVLGAAVVNFEG